MTVVTRQRKENFAIIPNEVAEDSRLSFEARGVLCYLLAKPNNWKVRIQDIQNAGGIGRDKVYRILKELQSVGYIVLDVRRGARHRVMEYNYLVYDCAVPEKLPLPEKPEAERPVPENTEAEATTSVFSARGGTASGEHGRSNKNPDLIKPIRNNDVGVGPFQDWWLTIPVANRPQNRLACENLFLRLPAEIDRTNAVRYWPLHFRIQALRGKAISLQNYLRDKNWRELVDAPEIDRDGEFIITPAREEWEPWLEDIRTRHGIVQAQSAMKLGLIIRPDRWPTLGGSRQLAMGGM